MNRMGFSTVVVASILALAPVTPTRASDRHEHRPRHRAPMLLSFGSMYGVDGPFVGDAHPLAGIPGDESPWSIGAARGHLDGAGNLVLAVRGLVFKDDPSVPADLRGINDESEFRAAVSCLTEEGDQIAQRNAISSGFPASRSGNALIVTHLTLPNPCVSPAVLVLAGSEDKWFAVTGVEVETADTTPSNGG